MLIFSFETKTLTSEYLTMKNLKYMLEITLKLSSAPWNVRGPGSHIFSYWWPGLKKKVRVKEKRMLRTIWSYLWSLRNTVHMRQHGKFEYLKWKNRSILRFSAVFLDFLISQFLMFLWWFRYQIHDFACVFIVREASTLILDGFTSKTRHVKIDAPARHVILDSVLLVQIDSRGKNKMADSLWHSLIIFWINFSLWFRSWEDPREEGRKLQKFIIFRSHCH